MASTKEQKRAQYKRKRKKILQKQKDRIANMSLEEKEKFLSRCRVAHKKHYDKNKLNIQAKRKLTYRSDKLRRVYGITEEIYDKLLEDQNYVCAVCGKKDTTKITSSRFPLCVDHCHRTKEVRGLLCTQCNVMLGMSKDSTEVLEKAVEYLSGVRSYNG